MYICVDMVIAASCHICGRVCWVLLEDSFRLTSCREILLAQDGWLVGWFTGWKVWRIPFHTIRVGSRCVRNIQGMFNRMHWWGWGDQEDNIRIVIETVGHETTVLQLRDLFILNLHFFFYVFINNNNNTNFNVFERTSFFFQIIFFSFYIFFVNYLHLSDI